MKTNYAATYRRNYYRKAHGIPLDAPLHSQYGGHALFTPEERKERARLFNLKRDRQRSGIPLDAPLWSTVKLPAKTITRIKAWRDSGMTLKQIGAKYGASKQRIHQILKKAQSIPDARRENEV